MTFVRTFKRRKAFLDRLATGDSESAAARAADGTLQNFKAWRKADPSFASDWEDAVDEGTDFIEDVATERALLKSDPLMLAILKARRPEKYDRNSGKASVEVNVNVEGAKQRLLNKVARLQAQRGIPAGGSEEVDEVLGDQPEEEEAPSQLLLPPPSSGSLGERGAKRRRAQGVDRGAGR